MHFYCSEFICSQQQTAVNVNRLDVSLHPQIKWLFEASNEFKSQSLNGKLRAISIFVIRRQQLRLKKDDDNNNNWKQQQRKATATASLFTNWPTAGGKQPAKYFYFLALETYKSPVYASVPRSAPVCLSDFDMAVAKVPGSCQICFRFSQKIGCDFEKPNLLQSKLFIV
ncbi:unnamed protein product [Ceratitis capitata]|uniref:(Mediterranean fruit fly) hypothetical protein n=1 Tax=Ceratitis capitata TaxID=7213 RepID=A0A811U4A1_CERCA|nr:unnamed protein product [Ceratitis capitata]